MIQFTDCNIPNDALPNLNALNNYIAFGDNHFVCKDENGYFNAENVIDRLVVQGISTGPFLPSAYSFIKTADALYCLWPNSQKYFYIDRPDDPYTANLDMYAMKLPSDKTWNLAIQNKDAVGFLAYTLKNKQSNSKSIYLKTYKLSDVGKEFPKLSGFNPTATGLFYDKIGVVSTGARQKEGYYLFSVADYATKLLESGKTLEEIKEKVSSRAATDHTKGNYFLVQATEGNYKYVSGTLTRPRTISEIYLYLIDSSNSIPSQDNVTIENDDFTSNLVDSLYGGGSNSLGSSSENSYLNVDQIIVDSKGGKIQSYIKNLMDYEIDFHPAQNNTFLSKDDYLIALDLPAPTIEDTYKPTDKFYDLYEFQFDEVESYQKQNDGEIDTRIKNSIIKNFLDYPTFFEEIDNYLNLDFNNENNVWIDNKKPFTKDDLSNSYNNFFTADQIELQITCLPLLKQDYQFLLEQDEIDFKSLKNKVSHQEIKTLKDYFYSDKRRDYKVAFFLIQDNDFIFNSQIGFKEFFEILNKTLIYVKKKAYTCNIEIIQQVNKFNLYELQLFEAYSRGRDFIQEKYTTVRPKEMLNERRQMHYDDNYFCYKFSGRDFNLEKGITVDGVQFALVHESDILTESDVTLGQDYKKERYFIEAIKYDENKKPISSKNSVIALQEPNFKYKDTFKVKDYVQAVDSTKYIEEDLEIITDYIDLNKCQYFDPEAATFENHWRDCYCSNNSIDCIYQKEGYCPYRFETEKHPRRIRTLSQEKSNRFNLIQELSKMFKVYPQFYIEHEADGKIKLNDKGEMLKHVFFVTEKGKVNKMGFRYEKNLTSIDRNIDSTQLTTKLYVQPIDSAFSNNGICTIEMAVDNISRETYVLDFGYYIKKGILNEEQVNRDLYGLEAGDLAFLPTVGYYNTEYDKLTNAIINVTGETMTELKAKLDVLKTSITAALETRQKVSQKMYQFKKSYIERQNKYTKETYEVTDTYKNYLTQYKEQAMVIWSNIEELFFNEDYCCYITKGDQDNYIFNLINLESTNNGIDIVDEIINLNKTEWSKNNTPRYCKGELFWRLLIKGFDEKENYLPLFDSWEDFKEKIVDTELYVINGIAGQYKSLFEQVKKWKTDREKWLEKKQKIVDIFYKKYEPFIKEGTWNDSNFLTDNEYYLAAQSVLTDSSKLKASYNISVLDISSIPEYEDYEFDLADETYIEDIDFFGVSCKTGLPNKERVLISGITYDLDQPSSNSITVQNYTTQFEDLFSSITASVQSLTFNENTYKRASNFTALKYVDSESLQGALDEGDLILMNSVKDNITISEDGTKGKNIDNEASQYQLTGEGLQFSNDGGQTWNVGVGPKGIDASNIKFGEINSSKVQIVDGEYQYFLWDKDGINSYRNPAKSEKGLVDFTRFNKYGLSLIENNNVRLRAGYSYKSNEENSGDYRTEQELTNQSVGFYLYNDSGQPIFKTETQSDYENPNGDYSARLSLKGEMFITNKVLSQENDGSKVTASLVKTYQTAYETQNLNVIKLNEPNEQEQFVLDNAAILSEEKWTYFSKDDNIQVFESKTYNTEIDETIPNKEIEANIKYYAVAFKKVPGVSISSDEADAALETYLYNNFLIHLEGKTEEINYYFVSVELPDYSEESYEFPEISVSTEELNIINFKIIHFNNSDKLNNKKFIIGETVNQECIIKTLNNLSYKTSEDSDDRKVNLLDCTNFSEQVISNDSYCIEVPQLNTTLSILSYNEEYSQVKYWDRGDYTDIAYNENIGNYDITKTKQVGIFINNKASATGGSDLVNNDISGVNNLELSTTVGVVNQNQTVNGVPATVNAAARICKALRESGHSLTYSNGTTHTLTVDGKEIKLRMDCTGLTSAIVQYLGFEIVIEGSGTFSNITVKKDGQIVSGGSDAEWYLINAKTDNFTLQPGDILFEQITSTDRHSETYVYYNKETSHGGFSFGSTSGINNSVSFGEKILSEGYQAAVDAKAGHYIYPESYYLFVLRYNNGTSVNSTIKATEKSLFETDTFVFIGDSVTKGLNSSSNSVYKNKYIGHVGYSISSKTTFETTQQQKELINQATSAAFFFGLNGPEIADKPEVLYTQYENTIEKILNLKNRTIPIKTIYILPPMLPTGHPKLGQSYVESVKKFINVLSQFNSLENYSNIDIINLANNMDFRNSIDSVAHATDGYHSGNYPELAKRIENFFSSYTQSDSQSNINYIKYNYQNLESTVQKVIHGSERLFMISLLGENEKSHNLQYNNIMTVTKSGVLYMGGQIMDYYGKDIPDKEKNFEFLPDEISVKNAPLVLTNSGYVWIDLEKFLIINGSGGYTGISLKDLLTQRGGSTTAIQGGITSTEPTYVNYSSDELVQRWNDFMNKHPGLADSHVPKTGNIMKSRLTALGHLYNYMMDREIYPRAAICILANGMCENINACISNEGNSCSWGEGIGPEGDKDCGIWAFHYSGGAAFSHIVQPLIFPPESASAWGNIYNKYQTGDFEVQAAYISAIVKQSNELKNSNGVSRYKMYARAMSSSIKSPIDGRTLTISKSLSSQYVNNYNNYFADSKDVEIGALLFERLFEGSAQWHQLPRVKYAIILTYIFLNVDLYEE